ncbi:MAG TPA: PAS domain S-box protein, partial [Mariprofundaceae bacterium]|nr:PAS domain S-box protein [Mariprofundaceae bacterium]
MSLRAEPKTTEASDRQSKWGEAVRQEQIKLLYEAVPVSILAAIVIASTLVIIQWSFFDHQLLLTWLGALVAVSFSRAWIFASYRKREPGVSQSLKWERYFLIGSTVAGVLWGITPFIMFDEALVTHQAFLAFIAAGISAGAVTSLSPRRTAVFSFLAIVLLPLVFRFLMAGDEISISMAIMIFLFFVLVSVNANRIYLNTRQNITYRMQSQVNEQALKASEERFRELFEGNRSVELIIDPESGVILEANHAAEQFYGYDRDQLLSLNIADINTLSDSDVKAEMEIARLEKRNHFIFRHRLASGEIRDVEVHSGPIHWSGQKGLYSIVHDITRRKEAEDKLWKLSQALEQASEAMLIMDRDGIVEYVNAAFTEITGYEAAEAVGNTPSIIKSRRQSDAFYKNLWKTVSSGEPWQGMVTDKRKDGSLYPANLSIAPIHSEQGEITHYVGIQQDMTDQQVLEHKFRQAQKMEALGTLVGGIAHDFNNMLAGITGNLYLAKKQISDMPDVEKKLDNIDMLSFRAASMIKQLLTFARKGSVETQPFGLISFIKEITRLSEASIPENINFNIKVCSEELFVRGNTTQLQQAIMNLLNNARDAVAEVSNPTITLELEEYRADRIFQLAHPESTASLFARMIVRDNGCGISDADKEHIFEPFYTTKEVGAGTGLGLAMVYGAIESQGGFVEVESSLG